MKDCALKIDDALWTCKTAFKIGIGLTPFQLVYEKVCHLLVELEHKALWVLKTLNYDLKLVGEKRKC